jgi:ubiquinone/menaquinone biosynthesis C-methylase UbiE
MILHPSDKNVGSKIQSRDRGNTASRKIGEPKEFPMTEPGQMFSDGKTYERMMGRWSKLAGRIFLDWLDPPKDLNWVEVGCGNGAFTEELIARCAPRAVSAVDPSPGQLDFARTRPAAKLAQFSLGDAQALPFPSGSFDAAAMALVITFVPDAAKAVAEMARVVKPGGLVATYMWDTQSGGVPLAPIEAALKFLGKSAPVRPSGAASRRDTMQALWQAAGLQAIETREIRIPIAYSSFDDFCESNIVPIGPAGQLISAMPPDELEQLKRRLREQLPIAADGRIAYEAFANAVKGRVPE